MRIGSGDCRQLLMAPTTKGFRDLLVKFVTDEKQNYNSYASPIDALRTGKILEDKYAEYLGDEWFCQHRATCKEMDVLISSLDFAKFGTGELVEFIELKTCWMTDWLDIPCNGQVIHDGWIQKQKQVYNQVQFQLLCTGLDMARVDYLMVTSYEDDVNYHRNIEHGEVKFCYVQRDEKMIKHIKERAYIFQQIKDLLSEG
jgi:hypothetical protein